MEQHYIIVFQINGSHHQNYYTDFLIVKEYPGDPHELFSYIIKGISDNSIDTFGFFINANTISITNLTRVF